MLVDVHGRRLRRSAQRIETPPPGISPKAWALHLALSLDIPGSSPRGAAFTPASLADLKAWYRADLGITLNGGDVSAWADQSGTGDANKNATQANPALQPLYVANNVDFNGRPTVRVATANDYMQTGTWASPLAQPCTWYAVYKAGDASTARTVFDGLASGHRQDLNNSAVDGEPNIYASGAAVLPSGVGDKSATKVKACAVFDGASSAVYIDNFTTAAATGDCGSNDLEGLTIGANFLLGTNLGGDIAEIVAYSGVHDAATRAQVLAYFARYGA